MCRHIAMNSTNHETIDVSDPSSMQPDNVLVTVEDGQVIIKLADWGYAQVGNFVYLHSRTPALS